MRSPTLTVLSTLLMLPLSTLAAFNGEVESDGVKFNFKELKQHSVVVEKDHSPSIKRTTYTINPQGKIEIEKDADAKQQCPDGTQVCMISRLWRDGKPDDNVDQIIPIAIADGEKETAPEYKVNKDSDNKVLGLDVTLHGNEYGDKKLKQKAIIKFLCDSKMVGTEEPDKDGKGDNALKFISYDDDSTLTLEWRSKFACEGAQSEQPVEEDKGGWGIFTWFILIVFLVVAAYLIFGSWLNYNKYGARGWDLLPHSDTLRDLPYLIKDFLRRAVNTFQGSGGRGGYSAI